MTAGDGVALGEPAPAFELPDTAGRGWSLLGGDAAATVVVFTCNHCPYAIAWHDRILDVVRDYSDRGVRFFAINSNDGQRYPRDSYVSMQERVAREDWPLPYLHDATQEAARTFGAKTTPDVFVLDSGGVLRYRGAPDADYDDPSLNAAWLREAIEAVLAGERPVRAETKPVGCSIKWS
jgi:peroxiredoxin